jgi:hypothetical protein
MEPRSLVSRLFGRKGRPDYAAVVTDEDAVEVVEVELEQDSDVEVSQDAYRREL